MIFIQFIILLIFCTSCWNQRELNELSIAMGLGIDKSSEDQYEVTLQVVIPQEVKEPSYYTPVKVYSQRANSLFEAFRKLTTEVPRKVYLPHFRVMVIGEELAKEGISDLLDMVIRDHEFRSDFFIIISKDGYSAKDVLEIMTPFEKIPSQEIYSILETSETAWAPTLGVKLDELVTNLKTRGVEVVLTGVTIKGKGDSSSKSKKNVEKLNPISVLQMKDVAVFKEDKLIGWLNEKESKGYNYIINNVESTVGAVKCPDQEETVIIEIKKVDTSVKSILEDGQPQIKIISAIKANIGEVRCKLDLKDPETIKEVEKNFELQVKDILQSAVKVAQEKYKSDIFGFGRTIHESYPKVWRTLENNWDERFENLPISYEIKAEIDLTGTIDQSLFNNE
jgi:spore germination protein KC